MKCIPRNLDYFRLGCAAGNCIVIFTERQLRSQMLEGLKLLQLTLHKDIRPLYMCLRTFPNEQPSEPLQDGPEHFLDYCRRLLRLRTVIYRQSTREQYHWFMLGDTLYMLATCAGLDKEAPLDRQVVDFNISVYHIFRFKKPIHPIERMCNTFVRMAKKRRGASEALFGVAAKIEGLVTAHLDASVN